jgi:hypothetical protein
LQTVPDGGAVVVGVAVGVAVCVVDTDGLDDVVAE